MATENTLPAPAVSGLGVGIYRSKDLSTLTFPSPVYLCLRLVLKLLLSAFLIPGWEVFCKGHGCARVLIFFFCGWA